jgi:glycosyltransferase involved in cell wall biosynthesis
LAVLPALLQPAWWPVPVVLGVVTVAGARARPRGPQADELDHQTLTSFAAEHGSPRLAPVAIVIAAFREASSLPVVLRRIPSEVLGLGVDVVVVDDGSADGTAEAAQRSRAHVLRCPANRGQGAALRLGYRFAREHGARFIVTTDADGQYDIEDLSRVLGPVVAGEADFVTGSRVLGRQETHDRVRRLGVHVFAWTVTVLTGHRITDTSFGLRAMRAELTALVTLDQPQYQSSELLIGMLAHDVRVLEVPATMQERSAGATKKGGNLVYGRRYAGVVWGTWWREYAGRAVLRAPAMRGGEDHARAVATR